MAREGGHTIVRYPADQGAIVAKMVGKNLLIPDEVHDYDGFVFQQVADASALSDKTVDRSGLSDEEWDLIQRLDYRGR